MICVFRSNSCICYTNPFDAINVGKINNIMSYVCPAILFFHDW